MFHLKAIVYLVLLASSSCIDAFPFKDKPTYVCRDVDGRMIVLPDALASTVDDEGNAFRSEYLHQYGDAEDFHFLESECQVLPSWDLVPTEPYYECKKAKVYILQQYAKAAYARGIVKTGASGYPKEFDNKEKIKFQFGMCSKNKIKREGLTLMEFPVFENGHPYDYNSKLLPQYDADADFKPAPGPTRIIYAIKDGKIKELCGVVGKTKPNNSGPFERCDFHKPTMLSGGPTTILRGLLEFFIAE